MTTETTQAARYASPEYAQEVEGNLRALQDSHRLAIHQWEASLNTPFEIPEYLDSLHTYKPEDICPALATDRKLPTYSMSLLPSSRAPFSMRPYDVHSSHFTTPGYLFDLTQDSFSDPAKVLGGGRVNLNTSENIFAKETADIFDKKALLDSPISKTPSALKKYYTDYADEKAFRHAVAADPTVTEQQLDLLGHSMERDTPDKEPNYFRGLHGIMPPPTSLPIRCHNEILVAATKAHIKAIVIPNFDLQEDVGPEVREIISNSNGRPYEFLLPIERQAILELTGAVNGLDHLSKGMDLPVVFYHVHAAEQGKITFFAQGREALIQKSMDALKVLEEHRTFHRFEESDSLKAVGLAGLVKHVLQINIYRPLEGQKITLQTPAVQVSDVVTHGTHQQNEAGRNETHHL